MFPPLSLKKFKYRIRFFTLFKNLGKKKKSRAAKSINPQQTWVNDPSPLKEPPAQDVPIPALVLVTPPTPSSDRSSNSDSLLPATPISIAYGIAPSINVIEQPSVEFSSRNTLQQPVSEEKQEVSELVTIFQRSNVSTEHLLLEPAVVIVTSDELEATTVPAEKSNAVHSAQEHSGEPQEPLVQHAFVEEHVPFSGDENEKDCNSAITKQGYVSSSEIAADGGHMAILEGPLGAESVDADQLTKTEPAIAPILEHELLIPTAVDVFIDHPPIEVPAPLVPMSPIQETITQGGAPDPEPKPAERELFIPTAVDIFDHPPVEDPAPLVPKSSIQEAVVQGGAPDHEPKPAPDTPVQVLVPTASKIPRRMSSATSPKSTLTSSPRKNVGSEPQGDGSDIMSQLQASVRSREQRRLEKERLEKERVANELGLAEAMAKVAAEMVIDEGEDGDHVKRQVREWRKQRESIVKVNPDESAKDVAYRAAFSREDIMVELQTVAQKRSTRTLYFEEAEKPFAPEDRKQGLIGPGRPFGLEPGIQEHALPA